MIFKKFKDLKNKLGKSIVFFLSRVRAFESKRIKIYTSLSQVKKIKGFLNILKVRLKCNIKLCVKK